MKSSTIVVLLVCVAGTARAQTIEKATGGGAISADDVGGNYTTITGPVIEETASGQLTQEGALIFKAPTGYEWATGGTTPAVSISRANGVWLNTNLQISYTSCTTSEITFTVTQASSPGFLGLSRAGLATFSNLRVRPTNGVLPNSGNITNAGTTGPGGSQNYGTLTMVVGTRAQLAFTQQPSNATLNEVMTPSIQLQLQDQFGNDVSDPGGDISITLSSGTGSLAGTTTQQTDTDGIVTFDDLSVDQTGFKEITATGAGLTAAVSNQFEILSPGILTSFLVESNGGGNIGNQTAGQSFTIQITAVDGSGSVISDFTGTVDISSESTISSGQGITANFSSGVLTGHNITFTSAGNATISVQETGGSVIGESNIFVVDPAAVDPATSLITADPPVIQNDGTSTSTITVQLRDTYNNNLSVGGDNVQLNTDNGSLSSTTDNNDGTYEATLASTTASVTATLTGTVNSQSITDDAQVLFSAVNTWLSSSTLFGLLANTYNYAANWSLNAIPTDQHAVVIPQSPANGTGFPLTNGNHVLVKSLTIENGAKMTVSAGDSLIISNALAGSGQLNVANNYISVGGDISLEQLSSSSSTLNLNGSVAQHLSGEIIVDSLQITNSGPGVTASNDVTVDGDLLVANDLTMQSGTELIVNGSVRGSGTLIGDGGTIEFDGPLNITTLDLANATAEFTGTSAQQTGSFSVVQDLTIDNAQGVTLDADVTVTGTLTLTTGSLTMASGTNLIANTKSIGNGDLQFVREVAGSSGWRLLSSPVGTTIGDFVGNTYTQGFTGADSVTGSPSILYYDETYPGTENQRWRKPTSDTDAILDGKGYYVYFFGDIPGAASYSNPLPDTINVTGQEHEGSSGTFDFGVTYTATADTGWNLIGNPFGATINWDDVSNWTKTNMDNTIYVWDASANGGNGEYLLWNGIVGSLGNGLLAPFQGFWVKANGASPQLAVKREAKTPGGHSTNPRGRRQVSNSW